MTCKKLSDQIGKLNNLIVYLYLFRSTHDIINKGHTGAYTRRNGEF
jgi:hypothetical protein